MMSAGVPIVGAPAALSDQLYRTSSLEPGRRKSLEVLVENRLAQGQRIAKAADGQGVFVIRCQLEEL